MLCSKCLAAAFVLTLLASALAAPPTTNPAVLQRAAAEQLRGIDEHGSKLSDFDDNDVGPLNAATAAYLAECGPALDLLRQAATLPHADWGPVDGEVPSVNYFRQAARVTWLAARSDVAAGRPSAAVDHLLSGMALARHVGQRPLLICHLVEIGCEAQTIERLVRLVPDLPPPVAAALPGRLDALPPYAGFAAVCEGERQFGQAMMRKRFAAPLPANASPDAVKQSAGMLAMTDQVGAFYDRIALAAGLTPKAFSAAVDAAAAKAPDNVLIKTLVPGLARVRESSATIEAKWAMLRTAAAIAAKGPAALAEIKDPFGDRPFVRTDTPGGYTLAGRLTVNGKPVTLHVGRD